LSSWSSSGCTSVRSQSLRFNIGTSVSCYYSRIDKLLETLYDGKTLEVTYIVILVAAFVRHDLRCDQLRLLGLLLARFACQALCWHTCTSVLCLAVCFGCPTGCVFDCAACRATHFPLVSTCFSHLCAQRVSFLLQLLCGSAHYRRVHDGAHRPRSPLLAL
jgi:hypothetical protein